VPLDQPGRGRQVRGGHRIVGLLAAARDRIAPPQAMQDLGQVLVIRVGELLLEAAAPCEIVPHLAIVARRDPDA